MITVAMFDTSDKNELKIIIKNKICDELRKLKYNFSYIGTRYFVEVIYILYALNKKYNCNFKKEIYPLIEEKYENSVNNIKCSIAYATDKMFYDCDEDFLKEYIGEFYYSKPGPKTIAFAVIKRIL